MKSMPVNASSCIINDADRIIGLTIRKAASTSIIKQYTEELGFSEKFFDDSFVKYIGFKSFSFVRNPYDRIVSVYIDKISKSVKSINPNTGMCVSMNKYKNIFHKNMTFNDFCQSLTKIPEHQSMWDEHIRPMYYYLFDKNNNLVVDFLGKIENMSNDYQRLSKFLKIKYAPLMIANKNTNRIKAYRPYYRPLSCKIITEIYKKDIEAFQYDF